MANEILIFDAAASNIDGTDPGSALTVGPGTSYRLREGTQFPAAPQTVLYASSIDTEGELPASRRYGNRTLTIKLGMVDPTGTLLAALQAKLAKFQREGGTIKRTLKNGDVRIYDIVAADGWTPNYDWAYWKSDFTEVEMTLPARPLSRGTEVDLGDNVETTLPVLVFTDTGVTGDVEALGRLVIDNDDVSNAQGLIRWGQQCRYYSSASTAALFYQAESCALSAASAAVGPAGASGAGSNTAFFGALPLSPATSNLFYVGASSTAQTHIGTFRVMARVQAPAANTGVVSLNLTWLPTVGRSQVVNTPVRLATSAGVAIEDHWMLMDLGMVTLPKAPTGTQGWLGFISAGSTVVNDDIYVDWVMLIPVDEGSGESVDPGFLPQMTASGTVHVRHDSVRASVSGGYLPKLNYYEGDYLLVPPAGAEARTLRVIVKLCRAVSSVPGEPAGTSELYPDAGIDDLSARLFVTPRYLT